MRYLVVEPHPDDMAFFFGGTVADLVLQGHEVHTLVVTNGEQGTLNAKYDTDEKLAAVQKEEQLAACEILGVRHVEFMNEKCHFVQATHEFREKIVHHVRQVQPAAVMTIDPWNMDENPDHRAVGQAVIEACSFAHFHLFHPEHLEQGLKTAVVAKVILGKTNRANTFVDISATIEKKIEAIACYQSQLEMMWAEGKTRLGVLGKTNPILDQPAELVMPESIRQIAQQAGQEAGLPLAEAFCVRGLGILDHIEDLAGQV